jgi:uncharacterized RDD family membrane protein YckC
MRCPKCQYITFDSADRCRNCGYDFSLAVDLPAVDLPMQDGSPDGPLADFSLSEADLQATPAPPPPPGSNTGELPLFRDRARAERDADAPLVTPSAVPRPPLAVRRNTAPLPRPRPRRDVVPEPRLALETAEMPIVPEPAVPPAPVDEGAVEAAPAGARAVAGLIDLAIIGGIDLAVLYFTLRTCDLRFADAGSLPLAPLLAFFALLNGGYFAAFIAAGGQTLGKMAAGLRVVPGDPLAGPSARVSAGHAIVRAAAYLVSAIPLGLGFVPAFVGRERRALHDRLADTRVVRA